MIMILLFGVMIHSVKREEVAVATARATSRLAQDEAENRAAAATQDAEAHRRFRTDLEQRNAALQEELALAQRRLGVSEGAQTRLSKQLESERQNLVAAMANLLQLSETELAAFRPRIDRLTAADAERLAAVLRELHDARDPVQAYKAVRRIEEMQKIFTFVDLHLDASDTLTVMVHGEPLDRFAAQDVSAEEIDRDMRKALEAITFNQVTLVLYSYSGAARDRTVETIELAISSMLAYYRASPIGQTRQFRYGRIGLVQGPGS
jgi:hypothetical protein